MEEVSRLLNQRAPSNPVAALLNEAFGPLGWEYDGDTLKVMVKVTEGHFLSVARSGGGFAESAALFGLEVKDAPINEGKRKMDATEAPQTGARSDGTGVGAASDRVGQGGGESKSTVPAGTAKPSRKVINDSITAASQIIIAKKICSQEDLVEFLKLYGATNKSQLTDEQAVKLLEQLTVIIKESK
jgi:hypothetical protein